MSFSLAGQALALEGQLDYYLAGYNVHKWQYNNPDGQRGTVAKAEYFCQERKELSVTVV